MEQNDMFSAWQEINKKLNNQEIVSKKTLAALLENNRTSSFQKLMTVEKGSCLFLCLLTLFLGSIIIPENYPMLIKIGAMVLLLTATGFNIIGYIKLKSIRFEESVTAILKKVYAYRQETIWCYIVVYILAILFSLAVWIWYSSPFVRILIPLLVLTGILVDYLIFHWTMRNLDEMSRMTKELKELEER